MPTAHFFIVNKGGLRITTMWTNIWCNNSFFLFFLFRIKRSKRCRIRYSFFFSMMKTVTCFLNRFIGNKGYKHNGRLITYKTFKKRFRHNITMHLTNVRLPMRLDNLTLRQQQLDGNAYPHSHPPQKFPVCLFQPNFVMLSRYSLVHP